MWVSVAVISGRTLLSSMPTFTARAMYSGKSTADWEVEKNLSTRSEPAPFTRMSKRLSWRWNASSPSRAVPLYCSLGSSCSSTWLKVRPASRYIPFSSLTWSQ